MELTKYGFRWGVLEVERTASNDGTDKRKKFNVITVKHENGDRIEILATREGFETKEIKGDN